MSSETIGERVKRLRLDAGLSQRECSCPGVSYAYISRIEAGTRTASVKALRRLAEKLGVSVEYLETGHDNTPTDALATELMRLSGSGFVVSASEDVRYGVATRVTFSYGTEERTTYGGCLTDALRAAVGWLAELDRLRGEIKEAERTLVSCA